MVFTMFSGRTDAFTHSLTDTTDPNTVCFRHLFSTVADAWKFARLSVLRSTAPGFSATCGFWVMWAQK